MKITTTSGFKCEIDAERLKEWDFVKCLALIDSEDESDKLQGIAKAVPLMFGKQGEKELMDHLRKTNGAADTASVIAEFVDALTKVNAKKLSSSR